MPDATELTKAIKKAASKAVKAEKPVEVCFGKVTSISPMQILVDQKFTLGAAQLVLTRNVTDLSLIHIFSAVQKKSLHLLNS